MQYEEKIGLLKALPLLRQIPDRQLAALAEFLRPRPFDDGAVVFEEASEGMSLYFISNGRIRITKRAGDGASHDLAVLSPGDFFGEMALAEEALRSASAIASGPVLLFELFRGDLSRWVKLHPQQAVQFFAGLVHIQSQRLRRTSNELALHFDLSDLLEQNKEPDALLNQVLGRIIHRLEGAWSAAAYLRGATTGAAALTASRGGFKFEKTGKMGMHDPGSLAAWPDAATVNVALIGRGGALGHLTFRSDKPVEVTDREELARTLTTVSRYVSAALELRKLSS